MNSIYKIIIYIIAGWGLLLKSCLKDEIEMGLQDTLIKDLCECIVDCKNIIKMHLIFEGDDFQKVSKKTIHHASYTMSLQLFRKATFSKYAWLL